MKLSRTVSYALQATLQLAETPSDVPVPCSQLASRGQMPERFLLQILRHLVTHGILRSTRGVDGGYTLERDPSDVSLLEVIEAIDGPISTVASPTEGLCEKAQQRLHNALVEVANHTRQELAAIKLVHLMKPAKPRQSA